MSYASPKTISSELLTRLEVFFSSDEEPSEFEMARLTRDANALLRMRPAEAYTALAAVEALRWNLDAVGTLITSAVDSDNSFVTQMNSAMTLRNVGLMNEACEHMRASYKLSPANVTVIARHVEFLCTTGFFEEAAQVVSDTKRRGIDFKDIDAFKPESNALSIRELGVSPERLAFELKSSYSVLTKNHRRPRGFGVAVISDPDGGRSLLVSVSTHGSLEDEMRLEGELAMLLIEEPGWDPCKLSLEIDCILEDVHQDA